MGAMRMILAIGIASTATSALPQTLREVPDSRNVFQIGWVLKIVN